MGSGFGVTGWGHATPAGRVTNAELASRFGIEERWIARRTGIHERRVVGPGETTASLAVAAGRRALERAGLDGADIAHLVLATATPEQPCPATSALVQHELGVAGSAHDVNAECSGSVYGLVTAAGLMALRPGPVLLIGSDTHSPLVHPDDRDLSVLIGDGAGAVVLEPRDPGWMLAWDLGSNGAAYHSLEVRAGGSRLPTTVATAEAGLHFARMNGNDIYLKAVTYSVRSVRATLAAAGVKAADVDLVVPHQANARIVRSIAEHTGLDQDRVVDTLACFGNTGAASVLLSLAVALDDGRVHAGDVVLLAAFGAGMSWGSALLEWDRKEL